MTVLIAAAGEDGRTARAYLADAGVDVEQVTSLSDARVRAATVDVVVVGPLEDATAAELRDALASGDGASPPLVRLGADEAFETTVDRPFEADALVHAVTVARRGGRYRRAVDDLYERCRERAVAGAEADDADDAVEAAKRRAESAFDETRQLGVAVPYEQLFGHREPAASLDEFFPAEAEEDEDAEESDDAQT